MPIAVASLYIHRYTTLIDTNPTTRCASAQAPDWPSWRRSAISQDEGRRSEETDLVWQHQPRGGGRLLRFASSGAGRSRPGSGFSVRRANRSRGSAVAVGAGAAQRRASHCSRCHPSPGQAQRTVLAVVSGGSAKRSARCATSRSALTQVNSASHRR